MRTRYDLNVPMRDGVRLSADVYLPEAEGRWPVILQRTPYDNNEPWIAAEASRFVSHGYAYVAQDCRGKFDSEGVWYPHRHEADDGDDTLTWCGTQPWSNARVGMTGGSYAGAAQWYAASTGNAHLKCIAPLVAFSDLFFDHGLRRNGVLQTYFLHWSVTVAGRASFHVEQARRDAATWEVPLASLDEALGFDLAYWKDFVRHETYDDFWRALSIRDRYPRTDVPALSVGGWHSPWELGGTLANFVGMAAHAKTAATRRCQKLIVGPWGHDVNCRRQVGAYDFGPEALIDLDGLLLRWFDRWLRGEQNGIEHEPPVSLFVMGANCWRQEIRWPLGRARPRRYFLRGRGRANSLLGDGRLSPEPPEAEEPPDHFIYNPERPVIAQISDEAQADELFADRRPIERRDDVLVYTSEVLAEDLEVTGPIAVTIYAATSAPDTDMVATLLDVYPDGLAKPLTWGIARGRYLASVSSPRLLEPHRIAEWTIDLWATSNVFLKGHRVRLDVTSSFFPFFGRNHNTGAAVADDIAFMLAEQTVHHSSRYPSHVSLPVVEEAPAPASPHMIGIAPTTHAPTGRKE